MFEVGGGYTTRYSTVAVERGLPTFVVTFGASGYRVTNVQY